MIRKLALGLIAAAAMSAAALSPTTASAGWKGGWGFHHHHGHHFGHGFGFGYAPIYTGSAYNDCYEVRRVLTPKGPRWRTVNVCAY